MDRIRLVRIKCLVVSHDDMMCRSPNRLYLRCIRCNRETPGWSIGSTLPRKEEVRTASQGWMEAMRSFFGTAQHVASALQAWTRR